MMKNLVRIAIWLLVFVSFLGVTDTRSQTAGDAPELPAIGERQSPPSVETVTQQVLSADLNQHVYLPLIYAADSFTLTDHEQYVADRINEIRAEHGLVPLNIDAQLTAAARRHSQDLADHNATGHTGSDGTNAGNRIYEAGYIWQCWGEIIAYGFGGHDELAIQWWRNSPLHYNLMISDDYEDIGVGWVYNKDSYYEHYWTVNFGTAW